MHKSITIINRVNGTKDKNHMIISIDAAKAFDKMQHVFKTEFLEKVRLEGTYLEEVFLE